MFKLKEERKIDTIEDAVSSFMEILSEEEISKIKSYDKENLFKLHFIFGYLIRSYLGLWNINRHLVTKELGKDGHPDDLSRIIIETIWENINEN